MASYGRGSARGGGGGGGRALVYQIDFTAVASGKRIASTKRRVRWRFGFANPEALAAGESGTACRGEEHDVTLVWSLTSGKRLVLADGQEVHYSNSRSGIFDFSWTMKGNNVLKIVAHASPPLSPTPGFRQYDFFVNGQSFFTFPKVFRIGLSPGDNRGGAVSPSSPARMAESSRRYNGATSRAGAPLRSSASVASGHIANLEAPHNPDEEEAYLQEAIRQSLKDDEKAAAEAKKPAAAENTGDLLDFGAPEPAPAAAPLPALPPSSSDPFGGGASVASSDPWGQPAAAAPSSNFAAPAPAASFAAAPAPTDNNYAGALVAAAPSAGYAGYGAAAAAPPADNNPYGATNPYGAAPAANPYGAPASAAANPYEYSAAPAPFAGGAGANPYGAPAPAGNPYGGAPAATNPVDNPYAAPAAVSNAPAPNTQWNAPAPVSTQQQNPYGATNGGAAVPPAVTPKAQQTPSSLGFGSPPADFSGFSPAQAPAPMDSGLTMNGGLSGGENAPAPAGSMVDQAYAKLANLDTFSLVSKKDEERSNPFASTSSSSIGGNKSLADMQKSKPQSSKEIMRAPGAMVVASNQNSNYGSQYGAQPQQPQYQQQQQQPYGGGYGSQQQSSMQQQPQYGQPQQQQQYGQPQQQPQYGQQQPMQQQQPYNPMQQQPPMQQQQQPYGQPPQQQQQQQGFY